MEYLNESKYDLELIVQNLSDEQFRLMVPAIVYIAILMSCGIAGNAIVFYYYWFQARITTYSVFISLLSVYDLMTCAFAMPMEISRLVQYYTFEKDIICKILRFSNYLTSVGSVLALIAIAADRYRRICRWSAVQMNTRLALKICLMTVFVALLLSWPALILYGLQEISIPNSYGFDLKATICTGSWEKSYKPYISAFYCYMFGLILICSVVLLILYGAIGKKIYRHRKKLARRKQREPKMHENYCEIYTIQNSIDEASNDTIERSKPTKPRADIDEKGRLTLMLVSITVLFLVSYVPLFAVIIWRQRVGKHQIQYLSGAGLVAFDVASTSFLISSAVNPWVYGILCADFRQYFTKRLGKLMCRIKPSLQNSASQNNIVWGFH